MFLLNINSRTIHSAESEDRRCRLHLLKECNRMMFQTFTEAKNYFPIGGKETTPCSFCLGPRFVEFQEDERN